MLRNGAVSLTLVMVAFAGCSKAAPPPAPAKDAEEAHANDAKVAPARVVEAGEKLDLATFPLPDGAESLRDRRIAELSYTTKQSVQAAFSFVDQQLVDRGWKQLPDAQFAEQYANADYQNDGYSVFVSVSPGQPGESRVMLTQRGNVAPDQVPMPAGVEKMHAFPAVAMYKSADSVEATRQACHQEMVSAGWLPYGGSSSTDSYRQNAVLIDLNIMSAPGQGGATVISVTSKLLSLELPAPPFADGFRYSDGTTAIDFDTDKTAQEVADFYRAALKPLGWKATTDEPVVIKWKRYSIFRNRGQEMITIATHDFEGRTRVHLDHQTAAEVAHDQLRANIAFGEKAKYRNVKWLPLQLAIPQELQQENLEDWALKITTPSASTFATAEGIANSLTATGWKSADQAAQSPVIRSYRLEQEERVIAILALKQDKLASWVAVVGIGGIHLNQPVK